MARKLTLIVAFVFIASIIAITLVACDSGEYNVTVAEMTNGTVTVSKAKAKAGDEITVTVTPKTGYALKSGSLKANNEAITGNKFKMPKANVTISAEFEVCTEINGLGIDNFWEYLYSSDKNFTFNLSFVAGSSGEMFLSRTVKYTPTAYMEKESYDNMRMASRTTYAWLDGNSMYEVNAGEGYDPYKEKYSASNYYFESGEVDILLDGYGSFFEFDGSKWKLKEDKLDEYVIALGGEIDYEGTIRARAESLRIEFTNNSMKVSTRVDFEADEYGEAASETIQYIISDIGTTTVTIPDEYIALEVENDYTVPPVCNGVTFDNFADFIRNGNYTLDQNINDYKTIMKDGNKMIVDNRNGDGMDYYWVDEESCYHVKGFSDINQYPSSDWEKILLNEIVIDLIFDGSGKYFEYFSSEWRIIPSMIDEYKQIADPSNIYDRATFESMRIYVSNKSSNSEWNSIRLSGEYKLVGSESISYRCEFENINSTKVNIPFLQ